MFTFMEKWEKVAYCATWGIIGLIVVAVLVDQLF